MIRVKRCNKMWKMRAVGTHWRECSGILSKHRKSGHFFAFSALV